MMNSTTTTVEQEAEIAALPDRKQSVYWEARDCGATHNDAMEATEY